VADNRTKSAQEQPDPAPERSDCSGSGLLCTRHEYNFAGALQAILQGIRPLLPWDEAQITEWDEDRQLCTVCVQQGRGSLVKGSAQTYRLEEGSTGWLARHRRPLVLPDLLGRSDIAPASGNPAGACRSYIGLPLIDEGRFVGTIEMWHHKEGTYSESDTAVLQPAGEQARIVIENARAYAEIDQLARALETMTAFTAGGDASPETGGALRAVLTAAVEMFGCRDAAVYTLDPNQEQLSLTATAGAREPYAAWSQVLGVEAGGPGHPVACREHVLIPDIQKDRPSLEVFLPMSAVDGARGFAGLPLQHGGRLLGMLAIAFGERRQFRSGDHELMTALSTKAAAALERARLYAVSADDLRQREEMFRRHNRQLAMLYQAATAASSSLSLDAVLDTVADQMTRALTVKGCFLWLSDTDHSLLDVAVDHVEGSPGSAGPCSIPLDLSQCPAAQRSLETGRPVLVQRNGPMCGGSEVAWMERHNADTLLLLPLVAHDRILGLVGLTDDRSRSYMPDEIRLAQALAVQAAAAIDNARLYEQARQELAERKRAEEALRRLQRVSREVTATLDLNRILVLVLEEAMQASRATHGSVMLNDRQTGAITLQTSAGYNDDARIRIEALLRRLPESVLEAWLQDRQSTPGLSGNQEDLLDEVMPEARSVLSVPVFFEGQVAGLIDLRSLAAQAFDEETTKFVQALAAQAAIAIGNAQRYREQWERGELLRRRADQLAMVLEVSRALRSDRPLEEILEEIAYAVQESVGFGRVMISVPDGDPPHHRRVAAAGLPLAVFERMKQVRHPWSLVMEVMDERFRISQSYYIAAEQLTSWRSRVDLYVDGGSDDAYGPRQPGAWHPDDILLVPLIGSNGEVRGILSVDLPHDGLVPDLDTVKALEIFAAQAALAIENIHLVEELRLRVDTLALFNEVSRSVVAKLDLTEMLDNVVEVVSRSLICDYSSIFLLDPRNGRYVAHAAHGAAFAGHLLPTFARGEGLVGGVASTGMPLTVDTERDHPYPMPGLLDQEMRSGVLTPLTVDQQVVGVLCVGRQDRREFSAAEVGTISSLGDQIAVAVENARLFEEVRRFSLEMEQRVEERTQELADALEELTHERDRVETLYRITSQLSASLDLDRILNRALELVVQAVGAERASVLMVDRDSERLIYRAAMGREVALPPGGVRSRFSTGEGLAGWVIANRKATIVPDLNRDDRWIDPEGRPNQYRAALAVPLIVSDTVQGALLLFHAESEYFEEDHLRLVETAATQVANAIGNAELYGLIRAQAERLGEMLKQQQVEATKSQAILEAVADGVIVADASGKIILVNAAAERVLQLPREDALGRATGEMLGLYGSQAQVYMDTVSRWVVQPETYSVGEHLATQFSIGDRVVSVHLAPVTLAEEFLGTVSVFRDVTVEVETERAKTEFVSMVSHELRTPITPIKGYVDLLLMGVVGEPSEAQRDFLTIVKHNADRLMVLVNDLLDLSRIESGRVELVIKNVRINELVDQVVNMAETRAGQSGVSLTTEIPYDLPVVKADPDRVVQILNNLVNNACQYTPSGGVVLVSAETRDDLVHVSVHDTGIGIPPEFQAKVFDRFYRADHPLVQQTPGTGLGLSIVKSLVEMHGGTISVESEVDLGSTFTFTLPIIE
jgi:PAS domain S-box-containing protein